VSPLRAPTVTHGDTFRADVEALRGKYPEIDAIIAEFSETLTVAWNVPHRPIEGQNDPDIYGVALDYPPSGSAGIGALFVVYHASPEADNKMSDPLRKYTLLSLTERKKPPATAASARKA
jgi:hypothetical protein